MSHLLSRNIQTEEALVDQLFNSSEKRLARILLLTHFGKENQVVEPAIPRDQPGDSGRDGRHLAITSQFLFENKFNKLGFIDYNGGLCIRSSLLNIVLLD